jgi:tetratricopeptide (TPR) repeat protein
MLEFNGKDTFEERVYIILDELSLGTRWERSSLILVVYRSEYIKNLVQIRLTKSIGESNQVVFHYAVDKRHYDIPLELLEHPWHNQAIFFVNGLRWGGGNMHREYLVEGNVKAVFWLTRKEAKQLARFSPDFWAFRHKVVEFLDMPSLNNNKALDASYRSFHNLYTTNANDFQVWIDTAEKFYTLGCVDEAILNFRKAFRKYPAENAVELQIAEILLSTGRLTAAGRILTKFNKEKADHGKLLKELERLNRLTNSIQPTSGGFLEQPIK